MVDKSLLLLLARQDMSKSSATAPVALSCRSVSVELEHMESGHAHKHVVSRTSIVLNAKTESHGGEGGSGSSKSGQLSRRKRDGDVGEIVGSRLLNWSRDRRAEQPSDDGDDIGDSNHFSAFSNEGGETNGVQGWMNGMPVVWVSNRKEG